MSPGEWLHAWLRERFTQSQRDVAVIVACGLLIGFVLGWQYVENGWDGVVATVFTAVLLGASYQKGRQDRERELRGERP